MEVEGDRSDRWWCVTGLAHGRHSGPADVVIIMAALSNAFKAHKFS